MIAFFCIKYHPKFVLLKKNNYDFHHIQLEINHLIDNSCDEIPFLNYHPLYLNPYLNIFFLHHLSIYDF